MKKQLFIFSWLAISILLGYFSLIGTDSRDAMIAQVTPEVVAVSFQKGVKISHIHVIPGQDVRKGDTLITVERPQIALEVNRISTEMELIDASIVGIKSQVINEIRILEIEHQLTIEKLQASLNQLILEIKQEEASRKSMANLSLSTSQDSSKIFQSYQLHEVILRQKKLVEAQKHEVLRERDLKINSYSKTKELLAQELTGLETELTSLCKIADASGTIGNVFAQKNELIPPYKTILSVYNLKPSIIKAFVNEALGETLQVGQKTIVSSFNREYQIAGEIIEVGSRITDYPDRIDPLATSNTFGQEIFIKISQDNSFLNGEKVYVYLYTEDSDD